MRVKSYSFILFGLFAGLYCLPAFAIPHPQHGWVEGYIDDINDERYTRVYELSVFPNAQNDEKPLDQIIFVPHLRKEFVERYEQTFGYTDIQRNINAPNRFAEQEYQAGVWVTAQEDQRQRQIYGEYIIKRLTEHHVDNYFKSNPSIRPVYELKERISNIDVEVRKGYKLHFRYSYSGNYLNLRIDNPYDIQSRLTFEMDPRSVGPTTVHETKVYLGYPISKEILVSSDYTITDGDLTLIGSKRLRTNLYSTITGSADLRSSEQDDNLDFFTISNQEGEKRVLLGLTWTN